MMAEPHVTTIWFALTLILLVSSASGEVTDCTSSPKLRFVAQLSINGCSIFVHDTGAKDGPHLAVEPLMCVTQNPHKIVSQYDYVIQQVYINVPVMLTDDAMLKEIQHQLRHLSPKSVKFATVSDISVSTKNSSKIQALGFDWTPDEASGVMRFGCGSKTDNWCDFISKTYALETLSTLLSNHATALADIEANGTRQSHEYQLVMQNRSIIATSISSKRYSNFAACQQLRFIRSVGINNCTVRVHQRLDMEGHFVIEPLLCHNITSITNESIMYDYSRDMYYLKLDVVLQDDTTLDAVRSKLADVSPLNVTFMRLWRAESVVASALSRRFEIGGLMVSGDWRSGQMRVYCRTVGECDYLKKSVTEHASDLWRHIKWTVWSVLPESRIFCSSFSTKQSHQIKTAKSQGLSPTLTPINNRSQILNIYCPKLNSTACKYLVKRNGREFVVIQQRLTGIVSFQRGWSEYETGFGDGTDFWIGLSTIHLLSINGARLRVEMKLWDGGAELHAEFAGFKVGDASTNYTLKLESVELIRESSSPGLTSYAMAYHSEKQFSTLDRQSSSAYSGCFRSPNNIKNGWWIGGCLNFNPNGNYGGGTGFADMIWLEFFIFKRLPLREVRMLLQIG